MPSSPANAYFRVLMEAAPDAMLVTDDEGVIILANAVALGLFGYEPGALEGHGIEVLIPKRFRMAHVEARARFLRDPVPRRMGERRAIWGMRRDGSEFHADVSLSRCVVGAGAFTVVAIRDLTLLERLARQRDELEAELKAIRDHLDHLDAVVSECPQCGFKVEPGKVLRDFHSRG